MRLPQEDEFVEVLEEAPDDYYPGRQGVVFSVAKCQSKITQKNTGIPVGDYVIWVGVVDEKKVKAKVIPAKWLRVISQ